MNKSRLLNWLRAERRQFEALLDDIGEARMEQPGVAGEWSVKDIVAHLTTWNRDILLRIRAAQNNEPDPPPPWPAHLEGEDTINAWIYEAHRDRPVRDVLAESRRDFQEYLAIIESLPDDIPIHPTWRLIYVGDHRFPAGEFFDHFHDDHEQDIRAWLAREHQVYSIVPIKLWQEMIWRQFGAAIDTLENLIRAYPDELWHEQLWPTPAGRAEFSQVWYVAYHALFWLELYLTGSEDGFEPPAPFTLIEQDENGPLPERSYTKEELLSYLDHGRKRCRATIAALTDEQALRRCRFPWGEVPFAELFTYNLRHVQEHAAQLSLFLGQKGYPVPDYEIMAGTELSSLTPAD
jgi:uncharacterized damage-inducible protein DinB